MDGSARTRFESWKEIASYLKTSVRTVQRLTANGMPNLKVGGSIRYRLSDVEGWVADVQR